MQTTEFAAPEPRASGSLGWLVQMSCALAGGAETARRSAVRATPMHTAAQRGAFDEYFDSAAISSPLRLVEAVRSGDRKSVRGRGQGRGTPGEDRASPRRL